MRKASVFFTLVSLVIVFGQNSERSCPCTYGGIWLDIIAVIDNSNSMTTAGLAEVSATLATIAGQLPLSQSIGQYSRLSLISFSGGYQVLGDLHAYQGVDDAISAIYTIAVNNTANLNIEGALQAAGQVIAGSHDRANVKTVIILFASAYSSGGFTDPLPAANQIKEGGTPIITVAFSQADTSSQVNKIATLASPGFAVNSTDNNVINEVFLALCQVNCFCPANWVQFTNNYDNPTRKFGECLRYQDIEAAWTPAKFACPSELSGAHLYQEFTAAKHSFVQRMVSQTPTYNGNGLWLIGLFYDGASNNYYWVGPNGMNVTLGNYSNWDAGYPQVAYGTVVGLSKGRWQNVKDLTTPERYVCQAASCDTANYCASV